MPDILDIILVILLLLGLPTAGFAVAKRPPRQLETYWSYEGETGPDCWGELDPEFHLCSGGTAQSPIDIADAHSMPTLTDIVFDYRATLCNAVNIGVNILFNTEAGSSIRYNEITYHLQQFHFHHPGEHTINGQRTAMELHFVHQDPLSGAFAVVGVLLMMGDADNPAYQTVLETLPAKRGMTQSLPIAINPHTMLPDRTSYYTYHGSLTTPPCSQVVRWLLLDTPVYLSAGQIRAFADVFQMNARPIQPRNARDLLWKRPIQFTGDM